MSAVHEKNQPQDKGITSSMQNLTRLMTSPSMSMLVLIDDEKVMLRLSVEIYHFHMLKPSRSSL